MDQSFGCIYEESLNLPENIWKCFRLTSLSPPMKDGNGTIYTATNQKSDFFRRWLQHNQEKHQITPV